MSPMDEIFNFIIIGLFIYGISLIIIKIYDVCASYYDGYVFEGVEEGEFGCGDCFSAPIRYTCNVCDIKVAGGINLHKGYVCRSCRIMERF